MAKKGRFPGRGFWLGAGAVAAYWFIVKPWHNRWGATDEEVARTLPGDEFVPETKIVTTHAVTIAAKPAQVWPWLVQLGQGRGGFYSYDFIENAMGLDIHTAKQVKPELQELKPGDIIPFSPEGQGMPVAILEKEKMLVLHTDSREASEDQPQLTLQPGDYVNASWGFYLEPLGENATRLIERWRADYNPNFVNNAFYNAFLEPGAFIMQQKMLRTLKELAESAVDV